MAKSSKKRQAIVRAGPAKGSPPKQGHQVVKEIDAPVSAARSRIMRSIQQKNTKPEMLIRRMIHRMGFRFRLHQQDLPGRPDIVLSRHHKILQVHGCFWHQHGCAISNIPRTRQEYWLPKLARNVQRDESNAALLRAMGWKMLTIWECELANAATLSRKLQRFLGKGARSN